MDNLQLPADRSDLRKFLEPVGDRVDIDDFETRFLAGHSVEGLAFETKELLLRRLENWLCFSCKDIEQNVVDYFSSKVQEIAFPFLKDLEALLDNRGPSQMKALLDIFCSQPGRLITIEAMNNALSGVNVQRGDRSPHLVALQPVRKFLATHGYDQDMVQGHHAFGVSFGDLRLDEYESLELLPGLIFYPGIFYLADYRTAQKRKAYLSPKNTGKFFSWMVDKSLGLDPIYPSSTVDDTTASLAPLKRKLLLGKFSPQAIKPNRERDSKDLRYCLDAALL